MLIFRDSVLLFFDRNKQGNDHRLTVLGRNSWIYLQDEMSTQDQLMKHLTGWLLLVLLITSKYTF